MSARAQLQGPMQRRAAEVYAAHEGKTVDEVAAILGVSRHTVTRAARAYGVRFTGYEVRKATTPRASAPRPQTRCVEVRLPSSSSGPESVMRVTLPKEPWL